MSILKEFRQSLLLTLSLFILCGLAYPLALTGLAQVLAPEKANGSLLYQEGQAVGSALVGQDFTDSRFLKGRPSAVNYNTYSVEQKSDGSYAGVASGSQNFGASNPDLAQRVQQDMEAFFASHPEAKGAEIPADLFTASGSGLDPHISPAAAALQIPALAQSTGLSKEVLGAIIDKHTTGPLGGIFGGAAVHVLKVNMDIAQALGMTLSAASVKE